VRAYCAQHHLSEPSFYAWRAIVAQRDQQTANAPPALAIQPAAVPLFVPVQQPGPATALEVVLDNGVVVRVPCDFDPGTLRRLLDTLRSQPC
jgi:hypothetical protein